MSSFSSEKLIAEVIRLYPSYISGNAQKLVFRFRLEQGEVDAVIVARTAVH